MTPQDEKYKKRLAELARTAYERGFPCFTGFLDLHEQNIYHGSQKELSFICCRLWGGYDMAERQMLAFLPDALSLYANGDDAIHRLYPMSCLQIRVPGLRFAEKLTHRDYLGALMNLGIDRSRIGDILVRDDGADVLAEEKMAQWLAGELLRVRHTGVTCSVVSCDDLHYVPRLQSLEGTVASVRLDALLPIVWKGSRSSLSSLITGGQVYVNGVLITDTGFHPHEGDIISVRGYGKCVLALIGSQTRKGRVAVRIDQYM